MNTIKKIVFCIMASVVIWTTACEDSNFEVSVEGLTLDTMSLYLMHDYPGKNTYKLKATVLPENAANKNIIWSSSDRDVATVTDNGFVTALEPGEARIFATTEDGGFRMLCIVLVFDKPIMASGLSFLQPAYTLVLGQDGISLRNQVVFEPVNVSDQHLRWESDDDAVVSVTRTGLIEPAKVGSTTIRAIARSSDSEEFGAWYHFAECVVTVVPVEP